MIIDNTYFQKGLLFIPNSNNINAGNSPTNDNDLLLFIDLCEREILLNALGVQLFEQLKTALQDLPNADQKWQDLVNGKTYTKDGNTYIWSGLKGYEGQSVLAFYTFCQYMRNNDSIYTTTGVVANDAKNAQSVNPNPKYIAAYNSFIRLYQHCNYYNTPTVMVNGFGSIGLDYYNNDSNTDRSLYQFLTDSNVLDDTAFPDLDFKFYELQNSWGV